MTGTQPVQVHASPSLDLVSGEIVCAGLSADDFGDTTAVSDLLDQIGSPIDIFIADGAYDGEPPRDFLEA